MKDYNVQNNKFINNGLTITEDLLTNIQRLKVDRITDVLLTGYLDYFTSQIEKFKTTIHKNPRFNWVEIQEEIDRLYKVDNNLTGIHLTIKWDEGNNLAYYNYNLKK